jgi:hypothetical protein
MVRYRRLIFNAVTFLPGTERLPIIKTRLEKRVIGTGGTNSARYCYSVWLRHLVMAAQNGLNADPKDVAELGPGDSIGVGLAALLCGADHYTALDVVSHASPETNVPVFDELVALFRRQEAIPDGNEFPSVGPRLESFRFPVHVLGKKRMEKALHAERVSSIRQAIVAKDPSGGVIQYRVPWSGAGVLPSGSQDLVFSQAVLEHVDALPDAYRAMRGWLRPSGFLSHQIDFKSHEWAATWDGHWRYGDVHWKILRGRDSWFINRQPFSAHVQLLEQVGFRIVYTQAVRSDPSYERNALARRFCTMPDEDRHISEAFLLATPS